MPFLGVSEGQNQFAGNEWHLLIFLLLSKQYGKDSKLGLSLTNRILQKSGGNEIILKVGKSYSGLRKDL